MLRGKHCEFDPIRYPDLIEDSRQMMFYRVFADVEIFCNVFVEMTLNNGGDNFHRATRQVKTSRRGPWRLRTRPKQFNQIRNRATADPNLASHHCTNAFEKHGRGGPFGNH